MSRGSLVPVVSLSSCVSKKADRALPARGVWRSGPWNNRHVGEEHAPAFLDGLDTLIQRWHRDW